MKRSLQEIVELVVFGLIALLIGTGVLWLVGAIFGLVGTIFGWLAALLWGLLSFLVPVALVAGAVVLIVRWSQGRPMPGSGGAGAAPRRTGPTAPVDASTEVPSDAVAPDTAVDAERAAESTAEGMPPAPAGTPPVAVHVAERTSADPDVTGSTDAPTAAPDGPPTEDDRRAG
jgi:predicted lipid-binding transport protein (Tim44 family)